MQIDAIFEQNKKNDVKTDLSKFDNSWYRVGAGTFRRVAWYFTNALLFKNPLNPISCSKVLLLRMFGAKVGKNVVIKPSVNIKYPWKLSIGNNSWIGEEVWIDNLDEITIGHNCCLSQGALLLCGSHEHKSVAFDLKIKPIILEDGVWIGARSIVLQGVTCKSHSILSANSVASTNLDVYSIYRGNPAHNVSHRVISY